MKAKQRKIEAPETDLLVTKFAENVLKVKGNKEAQKKLVKEFAVIKTDELASHRIESLLSLTDEILTNPNVKRDQRKKFYKTFRDWLLITKDEKALTTLCIEILEYPESKTQSEIIRMIETYQADFWEKVLRGTINKSTPEGSPKISHDSTALQWATIFYYVEPDLYTDMETKKKKIEKFKKDFNVSKTRDSLSNKHNEIVRVFNRDERNELTQHHIKTINAILPFLKNNYIEAFENAKDDLSRLQDNLDKKQ